MSPSWKELATAVASIRLDKEQPQIGKDSSLIHTIKSDLRKRAKLFCNPLPASLLIEDGLLVRWDTDEGAQGYMSRVNFHPGQKSYNVVRQAIAHWITEQHPVQAHQCHKLGALLDNAVYLNAGKHRVIKITADAITSESNGESAIFTDDALLPWPDLTPENLSVIGTYTQGGLGLRYTPDTPLGKLLAINCDERETDMPADYVQQQHFSRFLFQWVANRYALWPLELLTGASNSGKSTAFEKLLWLLYGTDRMPNAMPPNFRSLVSSLTYQSMPIYDNIDGTDFNGRDHSEYLDLFCGAATGQEVALAQLYKTNAIATYPIRNHISLTSRTAPFSREDLHRRVLHFGIASHEGRPIPKNNFKEEVDVVRVDCQLEIIARLQTVLRAHLAVGSHANASRKYHTVSKMPEYEMFSAVCAGHEDWLDLHYDIWKAQAKRYEKTVTDESPLAFFLRLWIGRTSRYGKLDREMAPASLWQELSGIAQDLQMKMPYPSVVMLGRQLKKSGPVLNALGCQHAGRRGHAAYLFQPPPELLTECQELYDATTRSHTIRMGNSADAILDRSHPFDDDDNDRKVIQ